MPKFLVANDFVEYNKAIQIMQKVIDDVRNGSDEVVWFLEHPPIYTAGASAKSNDLLDAKFPVHQSGRGGQYTYHGPGQLIVYVMIDLKKRNNDIRAFVYSLETWVIKTLGIFGLIGKRKPGIIGIWLDDEKIAAIGVRVTKGITWHGLSLNISTNLSHYNGIVPCGLRDFGVTSLHSKGINATLTEVINVMQSCFKDIFIINQTGI